MQTNPAGSRIKKH